MTSRPIEKRVETLENTVMGPGGVLEQLGELRSDVADLSTQFLQFRDETRAEFSAVHQKLSGVDQKFLAVDQQFSAVRAEIKAGDEETRRYMRVLHEEVIDRLTRLQNG